MQREAQPLLEQAPALHVAAQADAALAAARVQLPALLPPPAGRVRAGGRRHVLGGLERRRARVGTGGGGRLAAAIPGRRAPGCPLGAQGLQDRGLLGGPRSWPAGAAGRTGLCGPGAQRGSGGGPGRPRRSPPGPRHARITTAAPSAPRAPARPTAPAPRRLARRPGERPQGRGPPRAPRRCSFKRKRLRGRVRSPERASQAGRAAPAHWLPARAVPAGKSGRAGASHAPWPGRAPSRAPGPVAVLGAGTRERVLRVLTTAFTELPSAQSDAAERSQAASRAAVRSCHPRASPWPGAGRAPCPKCCLLSSTAWPPGAPRGLQPGTS